MCAMKDHATRIKQKTRPLQSEKQGHVFVSVANVVGVVDVLIVRSVGLHLLTPALH